MNDIFGLFNILSSKEGKYLKEIFNIDESSSDPSTQILEKTVGLIQEAKENRKREDEKDLKEYFE